MPLYDYRCTACGRQVEVMHGINDAGPAACADCGGAMRKALSPPAIHFKGSGWAKKDAAASTGKARAEATPGSTGDTKAEPTSGSAGGAKDDAGSAASSSSETKSTTASSAGTTTD